MMGGMRVIRFLLGWASLAVLAVLLLWLLFLQKIPTAAPATAGQPADAIVILTGGRDRVEAGLKLAATGVAPRVLISGVGRSVTLAKLLSAHASTATTDALAAHAVELSLGYEADSTVSNAIETRDYARAHHVSRLILVTAHYHMPRSLLEFHRAMPEITLIAYPIVPTDFVRGAWWRDEATRQLLLAEFTKYLAAWSIHRLGRVV